MKLNVKAVDKEQYEAPVMEENSVETADIITTSPTLLLGENETSPYIGLEELW